MKKYLSRYKWYRKWVGGIWINISVNYMSSYGEIYSYQNDKWHRSNFTLLNKLINNESFMYYKNMEYYGNLNTEDLLMINLLENHNEQCRLRCNKGGEYGIISRNPAYDSILNNYSKQITL